MGVSEKKQAIVAELKEQLASAKSVVLTGYKGLTVAQDTELRRELREAGVSYHVVKNTMLRLAAKEAGFLDGGCRCSGKGHLRLHQEEQARGHGGSDGQGRHGRGQGHRPR